MFSNGAQVRRTTWPGPHAQAFLPLCPLAWNEITKPWLQTQVSAPLKPEITALAAIWGC